MDNSLPDTTPFAPFEWMLSRRYLRARRKEGFISVIAGFSFLGIMLGVATLIVVMAVLNGFRAELLDKILGFQGHVSVYHSDVSPVADYPDLAARLLQIPGVVRAVPLVEGQAMASSLHNNTGALVRGISEGDIQKLPSLNNDNLRTAINKDNIPDEKASFKGFDASGGVAIGERMESICSASIARRKSGTRRSAAQSPPPMTFPALAVATPIPFSARNDCLYADVIISEHALLLEYGSYPPRGSPSE